MIKCVKNKTSIHNGMRKMGESIQKCASYDKIFEKMSVMISIKETETMYKKACKNRENIFQEPGNPKPK